MLFLPTFAHRHRLLLARERGVQELIKQAAAREYVAMTIAGSQCQIARI
jgi:hypothetical protein